MNLFESVSQTEVPREILCTGAVMLRGFAQKYQTQLFAGLKEVTAKAPFRHMVTPGGFRMSVGMTNCGALGWITDETGYRYDRVDPETKEAWPEMPDRFLTVAQQPKPVSTSSFLMPASLIDMSLGRSSLCIRIKMSGISSSRLFRCPWEFPQCFYSEACAVAIKHNEFLSSMAM